MVSLGLSSRYERDFLKVNAKFDVRLKLVPYLSRVIFPALKSGSPRNALSVDCSISPRAKFSSAFLSRLYFSFATFPSIFPTAGSALFLTTLCTLRELNSVI